MQANDIDGISTRKGQLSIVHSAPTRRKTRLWKRLTSRSEARKDKDAKKPVTISDALPCPFCGGRPTLQYRVLGSGMAGGYVVGCDTFNYTDSCFCRGNFVGFSVLYNSEEEAVKAWNRRAP